MNRAKTKRLRRSSMDLDFTRREITSAKEKADTAAQVRDDAQRIAEEKANAKVDRMAQAVLHEAEAQAPRESESNWFPPESKSDFVRDISLSHPDWPLDVVLRVSDYMWERYSLVRAALVAGLRQGRTLREQAEYGHGWYWPELEPLSTKERGIVLDRVRRTVCG